MFHWRHRCIGIVSLFPRAFDYNSEFRADVAGGSAGGVHPGRDRQPAVLFPARLDDLVPGMALVRVIDVVVVGIDLAALGFARVPALGIGRPGCDPSDLLRVLIYGYMIGVRSNRAFMHVALALGSIRGRVVALDHSRFSAASSAKKRQQREGDRALSGRSRNSRRYDRPRGRGGGGEGTARHPAARRGRPRAGERAPESRARAHERSAPRASNWPSTSSDSPTSTAVRACSKP